MKSPPPPNTASFLWGGGGEVGPLCRFTFMGFEIYSISFPVGSKNDGNNSNEHSCIPVSCIFVGLIGCRTGTVWHLYKRTPCMYTRVSPFRLKNFSLISEIKRILIRFTCVSLFHFKISLLFFRFFLL